MIAKTSTRALELQNGWSAFLIGLILLLPWETFRTAPWYVVFETWAPENAWGFVFIGLGAVQLVAAATDIVILRRIASALLAILFLVFVSGVVEWNPRSIWIGLLVPVLVGQACAFVQARRVA